MNNVFTVIFIVSLLLILHTYLLYPLGMMLFFSKGRRAYSEYSRADDLPTLALLIAAYNEEKVIEEKLLSVFGSDYPAEKIMVYVGSDASSDRTDEIVKTLQVKHPNLILVPFSSRVGKIGIINHLQGLANQELLILTDANVVFSKSTIFELVKYFRDARIGITAANVIKQSQNDEGISYQEKKYLSLENKLKACESNAFGFVMGAEGGCYAIRNNLFTQVPPNFIVDDFFITLKVINTGHAVLFNPEAVCQEDVANDTRGEYRRKVRISSGNFQNLYYFRKNLLQFWKPLSLAFWSHKVLRWTTPFLLMICLLCSAVLMLSQTTFRWLFAFQVLGLLMPLFNHYFKFRGAPLKFVCHFYLMNFALLEGFFRFTKGIKSSIWQPVKRNV